MQFTAPLLASSFSTDSTSLRRRDLRALRRVVRTPALLPSSFSSQEKPSIRLLFLRSADGYSLRTRREFVSALSTISTRHNLPLELSNIRLHAGFPEFDDITFTTSHFNRVRERLQGGNSFRRESTVTIKNSSASSLANFGKLISLLPSLFSSRQSLSQELGRPPLLFLHQPDDKISQEQQTPPAVFRALILHVPTLNSFESLGSSFPHVDTVVPGRVFYTESPHKILKSYFPASWSRVDLFPKALISTPAAALAPLLSIPAQSSSVAVYPASPAYSLCSIFDHLSSFSKQNSRSTLISQISLTTK